MHSRRLFVLLGLILPFSFGFFGARALASAPFNITATNVTMPESGNGSSEVTISGISGNGTIRLSCSYSGPATTAKIPVCECNLPAQFTVEGGQTITESVIFCPYGTPIPAALLSAPSPQGHLPEASLVLAGALMLGFGLRRRARRWLVIALIATGTLAGLAGISACAGGSNGMTPGGYQYTITAGFNPIFTNVIIPASTTINVTVL